ncbi:MAG TPA: DUF3426 domain-containing protein [Alphaproteobacteria bacterium]|nr:DUF3426 domain-containing protein [Alphaproteobacteria bacterium]
MIVSCPQCDTRFEVDPEVLVPHGRTVRCAKCKHTWTERPPEGTAEPAPADEPDIDIPGFDAELEVRAARRRTSRRERVQPKKRRLGAIIGWSALAVVVIAILAGGYFGRTQIVALWPPAAGIYEMIGLAAAPAPGLEVVNVRGAQRRTEDGLALDVTAEIVNNSAEVMTVPELRGLLLDVRQRVIHSWSIPSPAAEIQPGESVEFTSTVNNPPEGSRGLQVVVVEG